MPMSMTFIAKNNEEITMKDFISKYFLEVKAISIRTKLNLNDSSYVTEFIYRACIHLLMKVLTQKDTLQEFITN